MPGMENKIVPFAVEAAWATGRWGTMRKFKDMYSGSILENFDVSLAMMFESMHEGRMSRTFADTVRSMRERVAASLTFPATASLSACHDSLLKAHVISDLEILASVKDPEGSEHDRALSLLNQRLEVLGAYVHDKQYLLGIRRATMQLMRQVDNYILYQ